MRLFPVSIVIVQKTLVHVLSEVCEQSERERESGWWRDRERERERESQRKTDRQIDKRDRETENYLFICLIVLLLHKEKNPIRMIFLVIVFLT